MTCPEPAAVCELDMGAVELGECPSMCGGLDRPYLEAWQIIETARLAMISCGIEPPCDGAGVDVGQIDIPPDCCEFVGAAILAPEPADQDTTRPASTPGGCVVPAFRRRYRLVLSRCRPSDPKVPWGPPAGNVAGTVNAAARASSRDLTAVLAGFPRAWCETTVACHGDLCAPCATKAAVLDVSTRDPNGTCHGWDITIEVR